jgi:hypothetical protein
MIALIVGSVAAYRAALIAKDAAVGLYQGLKEPLPEVNEEETA